MDSASSGKGAESEFVDLPDLERHFTGSDIFFFLICTVIGIDGLGTLATKGGAGFTWLIVCTVLFAVPSAL
ncbi:MAG: glutamate:GABA antiporter, partial [Pseudonocardiales bacterium]|nr:glutamate:GABA antiporter [Pseudonocardiales bacterium]